MLGGDPPCARTAGRTPALQRPLRGGDGALRLRVPVRAGSHGELHRGFLARNSFPGQVAVVTNGTHSRDTTKTRSPS